MRNKIILFIIILSAIAGIVGFWYYQRNVYSKEILKLELLGPEEVELAQEVEYIVKYKNNGNIKLEEPRLIFEYPEYSILGEGETRRKEVILQDIYPGQENTLNFKTRLLGGQDDVKKAQVWLSYRPKNLKARYESETSHSTRIKSVPITLEFDLPSKIEAGEEIRFKLNYFSNISYPLSNLRIKVEYPSDFEFLNSYPQALEKTDWEIGLLNKAEGGRIEIVGNIRGEIGEQKNFKAELGSWQDGEFVLLKQAVRGVQIITPSLYISQQINGNPQHIASPGESLHYEVFFKNIGDEDLTNLFLVITLEGKLFDFGTIKAPFGDFESGDNSIIFDWRRVSDLQFLGAQKEGKIEFWVELKRDWQMQNIKDKNLVLRNKVYLSQAQSEFITKVNSRLEVVQTAYFEDEIFGNSGPIPPEVGKQTTYTVMWHAKNYYNDVKDMKVKAILGSGVRLTGKIFPEGSRLTFDSESREVVWEMEGLAAGKGVLGAGPSISFQIAFTPRESQRGTAPKLIGEAKITGEDEWTGKVLESAAGSINTTLPDDSTVASQEGIVQ